MRIALVAVILVAACGKHAGTPGAEAGVDDAAVIDAPSPDAPAPAIDAPMLPACANPVSGSTITTRKIGQVPGAATIATSPPADPRLFLVGARGQVLLFKNGVPNATPFIDLSPGNGGPIVDTFTGSELGLLGLAFHPHYAQNGIFYVNYTAGDVNMNTLRDVTARCTVSADPDIANPTCTEILAIPDPAVNHNGGMIEFGADGLLYISTGDGGGPHEANAQDKSSLLGKILRIDVDHQDPGKLYAIPADNPYAAGGGAPEIFMLGLRNPWRWSFDDATGDMWIADVGDEKIEELDVVTPAQQKGANFGWVMYEGSQCHTGPCAPTGFVFPKDEHPHGTNGWTAIIGGQVYRGTCYPDLVGWYFYGDFGSGAFLKARMQANGTLEIVDLTNQGTYPLHPTSFHEDAHGEIYETDSSGFVYHLEAGP